MLPFTRFHAATLLDLHTWSTLSRNEVRPFLARFGIHPLGRKFPMVRVYEHLLGLSPSDTFEDDMLGGGLVRATNVAEWFGVSGDVLLDQLRASNNGYPPLYAFGPKRNLMLRAQVEQLLSSPRNEWKTLAPIHEHALPASCLARHLKVPQFRIDAMLADKDALPARIISQGRVRFIVSDVAHRLTNSGSVETSSASEEARADTRDGDAPDAATTSTDGTPRGLFADTTARAATQTETQRSCTGSGANARRGECLHGVWAEAKLSGT
ncbi:MULTISPECIES: hypothetical protein [Roseovarius]|jgi:hypothetical protein|uniref:hypothetical protein n=1 Tax=Roseovarius TaxID=74030 RepID=UPI00273EE1FF|nr:MULTISPECIES: hypothetical protein [unclassified Roseovarius]